MVVQADVFQTLADPMRLRLVELLHDDEQAVNDLVPRLGIHQSGVSRHLRILHAAGFVQVRPDGARRMYSLRPERFLELNDWVDRYRSLWEARLTAFDAALELAQQNTKRRRGARKGGAMAESASGGGGRRITLERHYRASVEQIWELWTTRRGIESWWGPDGFTVQVHRLDVRAGGELLYTMTATGPQQVEFLEQAGMPLATEARLTYTEVEPLRRLGYTSQTDFIPSVEPYTVATAVSFDAAPDGGGVHMILTFDAFHDEVWTERATLGHEGELARLEAVVQELR